MLIARAHGYKFHAGITGALSIGPCVKCYVSSSAHTSAWTRMFPRPTIMKTAQHSGKCSFNTLGLIA
ncbi:hypothetical protein Taro_016188 [Colocasia esculenta]|uniref:Uncharacterized protein n=1 Tax=Colocasia esculenta TaxID=4460 RepID=A0A843UJM2_COLES|nr:hypothetical protein [Colocasia esculenta]